MIAAAVRRRLEECLAPLFLGLVAAHAAAEGDGSHERFLRDEVTKAHVLLRSRGPEMRLLIAFPEGNEEVTESNSLHLWSLASLAALLGSGDR